MLHILLSEWPIGVVILLEKQSCVDAFVSGEYLRRRRGIGWSLLLRATIWTPCQSMISWKGPAKIFKLHDAIQTQERHRNCGRGGVGGGGGGGGGDCGSRSAGWAPVQRKLWNRGGAPIHAKGGARWYVGLYG